MCDIAVVARVGARRYKRNFTAITFSPLSTCCLDQFCHFVSFVCRAIDGRILRCGIISSCQSAATSKVKKKFLVLSPSHVRRAIANSALYLYL